MRGPRAAALEDARDRRRRRTSKKKRTSKPRAMLWVDKHRPHALGECDAINTAQAKHLKLLIHHKDLKDKFALK